MKIVKSERSSPSSRTLRSKSGRAASSVATASEEIAPAVTLSSSSSTWSASMGEASPAVYSSCTGAGGGSLTGVGGGAFGRDIALLISRAGVEGGAATPVRIGGAFWLNTGAAGAAGASFASCCSCCCCCCPPERSTPRATDTGGFRGRNSSQLVSVSVKRGCQECAGVGCDCCGGCGGDNAMEFLRGKKCRCGDA